MPRGRRNASTPEVKEKVSTSLDNNNNIKDSLMDITRFFEVSLTVNPEERSWESKFRDVTVFEEIGSMKGDISRDLEGIKFFTVTNSELKDTYRGKGFGLLMYELTIKRILDVYSDSYFNSSTSLNSNSSSTWDALVKKYINVEKIDDHYKVTRFKKYL